MADLSEPMPPLRPAWLRERAHVPPKAPPTATPSTWTLEPDGPMLLLHVIADERERLLIATARELSATPNGWLVTTSERLFSEDPTLLDAGSWGRPAVDVGLGGQPLTVESLAALGKLISRRSHRSGWPVFGSDLGWLFGRLAAHTGRARGRSGWLSLGLPGTGFVTDGQWANWDDHPRLLMKSHGVGQSGVFVQWGATVVPQGGRFRAPPFVDLLVLASALVGGEVDDLAQAAASCGLHWPTPEPTGDQVTDLVKQLRTEAAMLTVLYGVLLGRLIDVAPGLAPHKVFSFGSVATHLLTCAGVTAPLHGASAGVSAEQLSAAASASFGGLFTARHIGVAAGVAALDITATYPTMFSLLGLTGVYARPRIEQVPVDVADVVALLEEPESWWDPWVWRDWGMTFVQIRPNGAVLPVTADVGAGFRMQVTPLHLHGGTTWRHWADLAGAVARGVEVDQLGIVDAFRLVPMGATEGLRPLQLPTGRLVNLAIEDLGRVLVTERAALRGDASQWRERLLKGLGSALTFGLLARHDTRRDEETGRVVEVPGPHTFLPASAAVQAGARLVLALAETRLTAAGAVVLAVHADSVTLSGTPAQIEHALAPFARLGIKFRPELPPGSGTTGRVVGVNRVIAADLTSPDAPVMLRSSDAGLGGHLADPSHHPGARTVDGRWAWAAEAELTLLTGRALPDWATRPVARRHRATSWEGLRALRTAVDDPTVGPFARYLRAGPAIALGPWPDADTWYRADWRLAGFRVGLDTFTPDGELHTIAHPDRAARLVIPAVADYFEHWAHPHPEGPVEPVPVQSLPGMTQQVGRDTPELIGADLDLDLDPTAGDNLRVLFGHDVKPLHRLARQHGLRALARDSGIPYAKLQRWLAGQTLDPQTLRTIATALMAAQTAALDVDDLASCPACRTRFVNHLAQAHHTCPVGGDHP